MKTFFLILMINISGLMGLNAQKWMVAGDTTNYFIFHENDTIKDNYYCCSNLPEFKLLDLDCDGVEDLIFKTFYVPDPEPYSSHAYHYIKIACINNSNIEFIRTELFKAGDSIQLEPNLAWKFDQSFDLGNFSVHTGPNWLDPNYDEYLDSTMIENIYLIYRKLSPDGFKYGWINFDARVWTARLIIKNYSIENKFCLQGEENQFPDVLIFPNPTKNVINFHTRELTILKVSVYSSLGIKVLEITNPVSLKLKGMEKGLYFLKIDIEGEPDIIKKVILN